MLVNVAGVAVVAAGVLVAMVTLDSIDESVNVARKAVEASREQFTTTRDALRLEQRAWLGYAGLTLQSKRNISSDPLGKQRDQ